LRVRFMESPDDSDAVHWGFEPVGRVTPCAPQFGNAQTARRGLTRPTFRFMESLLGFFAVHWDPEPDCVARFVWCPAFRRPGPAKAGTPNRRFMESPLSDFFRLHWDHEPTGFPLTRPTDTLSPTGGEGRGEGVRFMKSKSY